MDHAADEIDVERQQAARARIAPFLEALRTAHRVTLAVDGVTIECVVVAAENDSRGPLSRARITLLTSGAPTTA